MNQIDIMLEPVRAVLLQFGAFLPRLVLALFILVVGWMLAKAIRLLVVKALRAINLYVLTDRAGIDRFLSQGGIRMDTIGILGMLIYWLVVLASVMIAFISARTSGTSVATSLRPPGKSPRRSCFGSS